MILDSLELTNFRSYESAKFELSPAVTVVVGPNASGKTNLLESIYTLAATKSFRGRDPELVRHGQTHFRIVGRTKKTDFALGYSVADGRQTKQITHGAAKKPLSSHIGTLPAILFEPNDLYLVMGPPESRRRYLDFILCQTSRSYLSTLNTYRRVLKQRNSLLAGFDTGRLQDEIFAWDVKLTQAAEEIYRGRQQLISFINGLAGELYAEVAGSPSEIELSYLATVDTNNYGDSFMSKLNANLPTDLAAGFTTIGPHREDFAIKFGGRPINTLASRGEVRTVILILKLAELAYSEAALGVKPMLLLDDVFSELDQSRRRYLMAKLSGYQSIITTTEADAVKEPKMDYALIKTSLPKTKGAERV